MQAFYENMENPNPKDIVPASHVLVHLDELGPKPKDTTFYPSHWHEPLELIVVKEGRVAVHTASTVLYADVGESILIGTNQLHSLHADPEGSDNNYYCLIIKPEFLKNYGIYPDIFITGKLGLNKNIEALVKYIYSEHVQKKPYYSVLVNAKVLEILVLLLREHPESDYHIENPEDKRIFAVKKAIAYINDNLTRNITLQDICAEVCLSRYYFSHLFKETTGQTVSDFITNQRCTYAQNLILSGGHSLGEIAERSGFNSSTYFSTAFKKCKGIAPSQLIKQRQNT